jgi:PDZ domain
MSRNLNRLIARLVVSLGGFVLSSNSSAADEPKNPPTAQPAQVLQDDDAIKELRQLGASVEVGNPLTGNADGIQVTISAEWHGKPPDLKLLKRLAHLERFSVRGVAITDDDLKQLDGMGRLEMVELFGTKVTADGAARLAEMYPGIKIDRRSSAMLGVAAQAVPAGCQITLVQVGSAADQAGLKAEDIILKFQDHEIPDFPTLVSQIGACQPGDKVTVELRRGNEALKKEVKLGAWK